MSSPTDQQPDAVEAWPSGDAACAWEGDSLYDFQFHPGEEIVVSAAAADAVEAARHFRDVLARFASGVTVVTSMSQGQPVGMTCQSFSSVSLVPPLVLFVPSCASRAWPLIRASGQFCVNFLADDQMSLSSVMASRGTDKFADVDWEPAPATGSPRLAGTLGHVDCRISGVHPGGDHDIVVGRVLDLEIGPAERPLLFYRGDYHTTG